jgi:hypothetical protein
VIEKAKRFSMIQIKKSKTKYEKDYIVGCSFLNRMPNISSNGYEGNRKNALSLPQR